MVAAGGVRAVAGDGEHPIGAAGDRRGRHPRDSPRRHGDLREYESSLDRPEEVREAAAGRLPVLQAELTLILEGIGGPRPCCGPPPNSTIVTCAPKLAAGPESLGGPVRRGRSRAGAHAPQGRLGSIVGLGFVLYTARQASASAGRGPIRDTLSGGDLENAVQVGTVHGASTAGVPLA
jgi:hypothetical protein